MRRRGEQRNEGGWQGESFEELAKSDVNALGGINNSDSSTPHGEVNKCQSIPQHGGGKHLADNISSRQPPRKGLTSLASSYLRTFLDGSLGRDHTLPICLFCRPVTKTYVRHMQRNNRISGKQLLKAYFKKTALLNLGV